METLKIEVSVPDLVGMVKAKIGESIMQSLSANEEQMKRSIDQYFTKSIFDNKSSQFESALDWAVEGAFRQGLEEAMTELNFKEVIAAKAKELLSDNNFITELATKKVRASLGLTNL